jgi:RNA polymerase-binding transcription factor DksA
MATRIDRTRNTARTRHARLERLLSLQGTVLRKHKQILRESQASGVIDAEEHSVDAEEQGVGFSLLELASQNVQEIETALRRLDAGEFGTCSECQAQIGEARLRALPFTALCLACGEAHDVAAAAAAGRATAAWKERLALTNIGSPAQ